MKSFLVPVLLVSLVAGSSALNCYVCSGPECRDPLDTTAAGVGDTCPASSLVPYTHCIKTTSGNSVVRACTALCVEGCVGDLCNYCCTGNLCNGSTAVSTSFVAMGVALLGALIFSRQ
ncbi:uncharacterized protein LOC121420949 [Lytechinus variegatus]|uniref:uncharacterized protein LOC121420949 n=1 Tax=Lytechinus variegatus TaxID=7654 RepID=UPI001BB248A7|nr:uncharacterized protein LOC121420949 [Lytechinus variegatus]